MSIPDISTLDADDLILLINAANNRYREVQEAEAHEEAQTRVAIGQAITTLEALIGDSTVGPNLTSIVGVQRYTDEQIGDNQVLALRLLMQGLEIAARTLLDVARVSGRD